MIVMGKSHDRLEFENCRAPQTIILYGIYISIYMYNNESPRWRRMRRSEKNENEKFGKCIVYMRDEFCVPFAHGKSRKKGESERR